MQRRTGASRGRLGAVLFTDIVGSTAIAAEMGNRRWAALISRHHQVVRRELRRFAGREHDTAGDGFFATFERPVDAIRGAVAIVGAVRTLGIELRAGVTFGELEVEGGKPSGLAVNTAARVMSVAGPGEVLVPASVRDIVSGAGISFQEHGTHHLKGLEDEAHLFLVTAVEGEPVGPPLGSEDATARRAGIAPASSRTGRRTLVGAVAAAAVAVAAILWFTRGGDAPPEQDERAATYLVELDPEDGSERQRIEIVRPSRSSAHPDTPRSVEAGKGAVWVLDPGFEGPTLLHVDPEDGDAREPILIEQPAFQLSMVTAFDAVWVAAADRLVRVSASTDEQQVVHRFRYREGDGDAWVTADRHHLWVGRTDGVLMRLTPSGETAERKVSDSVDLLAGAEEGVYVIDHLTGEVSRVDRNLETLWTTPVVGTINRIAFDGDYVWLLDWSSGIVTRLSTSSGVPAGQAPIGPGATDLAVGGGALWVTHDDGTISRIDRVTREVTPTFVRVGGEASAIAFDLDRGSLWVDVGPIDGDVAA
jgi:class 3 adenylate cyclase/streptogramin lyase